MVARFGEIWSQNWLFPKSKQIMAYYQTREVELAQRMFKDTGINVTAEGKQHLGAVIGSSEYRPVICRVQSCNMGYRIEFVVRNS